MTTQHITTKNRTRLIAPLLALMVLLAGVGLPAAPAGATAWDPHVALTGRATCSPFITSQVTWMWVSASNGEQGWATLSGSPTNTRGYRFDLYRVGTGGTTVTVTWGCSGFDQGKTTFGVNRPAVGVYATRNLCPTWRPGPCWI